MGEKDQKEEECVRGIVRERERERGEREEI